MAATPSYDELVSGADAEIATFQLAGWVGAVVLWDGEAWTAIRRPGGIENVAKGIDLRTAIRHYTSALNQAATHITRSPA